MLEEDGCLSSPPFARNDESVEIVEVEGINHSEKGRRERVMEASEEEEEEEGFCRLWRVAAHRIFFVLAQFDSCI